MLEENQWLQIPNPLWIEIAKYLTYRDTLQLSRVNKPLNIIFKTHRDSFFPLFFICANFFKELSKFELPINISDMPFVTVKQFCALFKDYVIDFARGTIWEIKQFEIWLKEHSEFLTTLQKITKKPEGYDFENIRKKIALAKEEWNNHSDDYKDIKPTDKETFLFYLFEFHRAYEKDRKFSTAAVFRAGSHFLYEITFIAKRKLVSIETISSLNYLIGKPNESQMITSLFQLKETLDLDNYQDRETLDHITLNILGRCLNLLFKCNILNENNIIAIKDLLKPYLNSIINAHYPIIANKKEKGFQIRWSFDTQTKAIDTVKKLKVLEFTPKIGKVKEEHAVDLDNIEPAEIILASRKLKK